MFRRVLLGLAAAAALATSAAILMVSLAFALYALAEPYAGRAGAAAIVAAAAALMMGLLGWIVARAAGEHRWKRPKSSSDLIGGAIDRLIDLVREKPVMTIFAAIGAGFMAIRHPGYLGSAVRAFLDGKPSPKRK